MKHEITEHVSNLTLSDPVPGKVEGIDASRGQGVFQGLLTRGLLLSSVGGASFRLSYRV